MNAANQESLQGGYAKVWNSLRFFKPRRYPMRRRFACCHATVQQITTGRGLPIEHFTSHKYAGQLLGH